MVVVVVIEAAIPLALSSKSPSYTISFQSYNTPRASTELTATASEPLFLHPSDGLHKTRGLFRRFNEVIWEATWGLCLVDN